MGGRSSGNVEVVVAEANYVHGYSKSNDEDIRNHIKP